MIANVFKDQTVGLAAVLVKGKQQSVTAVQPRAVKVLANLADVGLGKIAALKCFANLGKAGDLVGSQIVIDKYFHGRKDRKRITALRRFFQLRESDSGDCAWRGEHPQASSGRANSVAAVSQWSDQFSFAAYTYKCLFNVATY